MPCKVGYSAANSGATGDSCSTSFSTKCRSFIAISLIYNMLSPKLTILQTMCLGNTVHGRNLPIKVQ